MSLNSIHYAVCSHGHALREEGLFKWKGLNFYFTYLFCNEPSARSEMNQPIKTCAVSTAL